MEASNKTYAGRRVAFLHHQLALGGSERVSYDAACYLRGLGIESYFMAARSDERMWTDAGLDAFPLIHLPEHGKNKCFVSPNVDVIIESIQRLGIELLFVAVPDIVLPTRIQTETKCRVVFWLHNVPYLEAITKIESYRTQGERSWYNRLMWHLVHRPRLLWGDRLIRKWQERYKQKLATYDATLVLCEDFRTQMIRELGLGATEAERILVKTNCLDLELEPKLEKRKQLIYMGRLSRSDKRVDRLLRIWAQVERELPEWELAIYGRGDKEERVLRRLATELGLERCRFAGFASEPREVYRDAAVLCLTSSYEGFPLVLAEAQNQGVVPIAYDTSAGIRAVLAEGAGVLVPAYDSVRYAEELRRLCLDADYRRGYQEAGLRHRERFGRAVGEREWAELLPRLFCD